jgi:hypothetical protein
VLLDAHPEPIFPRWVGWFSLATAVLVVPDAGAAVFTSGPLAWDGAISFWLRNVLFGAFFIVMFFVLRRAISREHAG